MIAAPGQGYRRGFLGIALGILGVAAAAFAQEPLEIGVTEKLEFRRLHTDTARAEAFRNRLEVTANRGIFSAWLRLETLQISDASLYDPYGAVPDGTVGAQRIDETEVTRRLFSIEKEHLRVQAGDVSHVFGRGLALSVFEDEELNFDTRLEGVRGQADHDLGKAAAVAGSHEGDRFRGVFVEPRPFDLGKAPWGATRARFGASFVEAWGAELNTDILPREQHAGALAEFVAGPATLYGEYLERKFPGKDGIGALGTPGRGAFVAADVTVHGVTLSGEYRDFFRFDHRYNDPPTTLRQHPWTSLNRVNGQVLQDIPDDDANGHLVQLDWSRGGLTEISASFARLDQDEGPDRFTELFGFGKTEWRERIHVTGGVAESELKLGTNREERISGVGEAAFEVDESNSVTFQMEWAEVQTSSELTQAFEFSERFHERIFAVSWGRSPWLNLTVAREDTGEDDPTETRDHWANIFAELAVASGHDVVLSYGSERGGWKCTGGVCFFEPEFEGIKVKWIGRF